MKERNPEQTRSRILMSAFEEFHLHGFQGARIEAVLKKTGLKKGALYHHFPSKLELGYAVVDEIIKGFVQEAWFEPIASAEDPVIGIKEMLDRLNTCATQQDIMLGCPLNNLEYSALIPLLKQWYQRRVLYLIAFKGNTHHRPAHDQFWLFNLVAAGQFD